MIQTILKIEGEKMKKSIRSVIALSLILNLSLISSSKYVSATSNDDVDTNECFQEDGVLGDISDIDNIRDIFFSFRDEDELNWYYIGKGKDQIAEAPKESVGFLKENSAYYLGDTSNKILYLTFDEGYENGHTGEILDILKEYDDAILSRFNYEVKLVPWLNEDIT